MASGNLVVSTGRFSTGTVGVGAGGQFNLTGGSADLDTIDLTGGGSFGFTGGTLHAQNIVCDDLINQGGTLSPGNSAGSTAIGGNYAQQSSATLAIEIGGNAPATDFDTVGVEGNAMLAGVLDVSLINGFSPAAGQQFTVLTAGSVANNGLALGGSAASLFNLIVGTSSVTLQAILQGDFNHDNVVDASDYVAWQMGLGTIYSPSDYDVWRAHFGETIGGGGFAAGAADASVPEPGFVGLLSGTWLLSLRRARRLPS